MRNAWPWLVLVAACSSKSTATIDAAPGGADAAPSAQCLAPVSGTPALKLAMVATGLSKPVLITHAPGDPTRMFIAEQTGKIRVVQNGTLLPDPFLDLSALVTTASSDSGSEEGLLGLAFHPHYGANGRFFVNYTDTTTATPGGNTNIVEYTVSPNPNVANKTGLPLVQIAQPFTNHKGGNLAFGPDGYLYDSQGDGGSQYDPSMNGQHLTTKLAKITRYDVSVPGTATSPATNPYFGQAGMESAIWHYGLRNPWRWSFDRQTGDMWIGDVGQDNWEELDFVPAGTSNLNFGWGVVEGMNHCPMGGGAGCNPPTGATPPIFEYNHATGNPSGPAIIGGFVYRGCKMPGYAGTYFFGDDGAGFVASLKYNGATVSGLTTYPTLAQSGISTFGEDNDGELYLCSVTQGTCWEIVPGP